MIRRTLGSLKRLLRRATGVEGLRGESAALRATLESFRDQALWREAEMQSQLEAVRDELGTLRREALVRQVLLDRRSREAAAMPPTVYVLTAHEFNHGSRGVPIDERLLRSPAEHVFYFFDRGGIPPGFRRPAVAEIDLNPGIHEAGKRHLAEWSFFLTEYHRPFLNYPCAAVSSRFYEKNRRLAGRLDWYLELFGHYLRSYGYGYLPSYDRLFQMVDLDEYHREGHLGTRAEGFDLIERLYGVRLLSDYRYTADYWCNYIAFRSRADFETYIEFYLPLIRQFFNDEYELVAPYDGVVNRTGGFRNEKPFTLLLELVSHLFFYCKRLQFFGLHYDGFYEVDERDGTFRKLLSFD